MKPFTHNPTWIGAASLASSLAPNPKSIGYEHAYQSVAAGSDQGFIGTKDSTGEAGAGAPLLRREFAVARNLESADLRICGLGYYEAWINGRRVGDHVLDPAQTDYQHRVFYVSYDVSDLLRNGTNAIGVMLGNGWYNQDRVWAKKVVNADGSTSRIPGLSYGQPRLLAELQLSYKDGRKETLQTDTDWRWAPGPVVDNNIYAGERYDARRELNGWCEPDFDTASWSSVIALPAPGGEPEEQVMPPMRRIEELKPTKISPVEEGRYVVDMGQNFSGWARISVEAPAGTEIKMRFAETVFPDGTLDTASTGVFATKVEQTDRYICRGAGLETWEPRFTYHGFRYIEVSGWPGELTAADITGVVVHTDLEPAGAFVCSDERLNRLHHMVLWTHRSNIHGLPEDCPARERCGWLGDANLVSEYSLWNFKGKRFWEKYLDDMETSRSINGGIPGQVVPGKRGNVPAEKFDWLAAYIMIAYYVYLDSGDKRVLQAHWEGMQQLMTYFGAEADCWILHGGYGDFFDPGTEAIVMHTPQSLSTTLWFCRCAQVMTAAATALGQPESAAQYKEWQANIAASLTERYYDTATGSFGSQAANALALAFGVAPSENERILSALVCDIRKRDMHPNVGVMGLRFLFEVLTRNGHGDIALAMLHQNSYPSFGYLIERGATTLWESWGEKEHDEKHGARSLSHPFMGGYDNWFYNTLAGIRPDPEHPGFKAFTLVPHPIPGLDWVDCHHDCPYGRIVSNWKLSGADKFQWHIEVPEGTVARATLPFSREVRKLPAGTYDLTDISNQGDGHMQMTANVNEVVPHPRGRRPRDDWRGQWIGANIDPQHQPVYLRREFAVAKPVLRATVFFCGLGWSELFIGGRRVGDYLMGPGFTNYDKRTQYLAFDVTDRFRSPGRTPLDVILFDGWYALERDPWHHQFEKKPYVDKPKLLLDLHLEHTDGTETVVSSDAEWRWSFGPIRRSWLCEQDCDFRVETGPWQPVAVMAGPAGQLVAQREPPTRVVESIRPVELTETGGAWTFAFDREFTGHVTLRTAGPAGTRVTLATFPARLEPRNFSFVLKGVGIEEFAPRETYTAIEKVTVAGLARPPALEDLTGCRISGVGDAVSSFACSDATINWLHECVRRTQANYVTFLPNDPTREFKAWTQDIQGMFWSAMYLFDSQAMYERWQSDLLDTQASDGNLPNVAPGPVYNVCNSPWWGGCGVWLPWEMWLRTGDDRLLRESYAGMKRYVDFLTSQARDGLQDWGLSDWLAWEATPRPIVNTPAAYHFARIVSRTAAMLGHHADADRYTRLAEEIRDGFNARFLDPSTGIYGIPGGGCAVEDSGKHVYPPLRHDVWWPGNRPCTQTGQALPLALGLVPDKIRPLAEQALLREIAAHNHHISTGFIGTPYLLQILADLAPAVGHALTTQRDFPSWYAMTKGAGCDQMMETWNGGQVSMPSLGGNIAAWNIEALAGIRPDPAGPGFQKIIIQPAIVGALTWVQCHYDSPAGRIVSNWTLKDGSVTMEIAIPANSTAIVRIPTNNPESVRRDGALVEQSPGVTVRRRDANALLVEVGGGCHRFAATLQGPYQQC